MKSSMWPNCRFEHYFLPELFMPKTFRTEAERVATPKPTPLPGYALPKTGGGQKVSLERGTATRSKKNPGKRAKKGG
jgi:hypothetical protein